MKLGVFLLFLEVSIGYTKLIKDDKKQIIDMYEKILNLENECDLYWAKTKMKQLRIELCA